MHASHVGTYLQDHLSGSVVALELLEHLEATYPDRAGFFARLRADIAADQDELRALMARLGVSTSTLRAAVAWVAEKAGRLKLRTDDAGGGTLRLLEATELVAVGIEGKRSLWVALAAAAADVPEFRGPDYDRLIRLAVEQRERIEPVRVDAARAALR